MIEWIGLLFEIVFLALGVYLYLYALGKVKLPTRRRAQEAERFRLRNQRWLRVLALALRAVFGLNIFLHLRALL